MFLVKAGTTILVQKPDCDNYSNWDNYFPYITRVDRIYEKENVWDIVTVLGRHIIPDWARMQITEHHKNVIMRNGMYALVDSKDIEYLD